MNKRTPNKILESFQKVITNYSLVYLKAIKGDKTSRDNIKLLGEKYIQDLLDIRYIYKTNFRGYREWDIYFNQYLDNHPNQNIDILATNIRYLQKQLQEEQNEFQKIN